MSIQSTRTITREAAISRILEVNTLVDAQDYKGLEGITFEADHNICNFVVTRNFVNKEGVCADLSKLTDSMVEEMIDLPFYRFSMFENYQIREAQHGSQPPSFWTAGLTG